MGDQHKTFVQNKLLERLYIVHVFLAIDEVRFFVFQLRENYKTFKIGSRFLIKLKQHRMVSHLFGIVLGRIRINKVFTVHP